MCAQGVQEGMLICLGGFTKGAKDFARGTGIQTDRRQGISSTAWTGLALAGDDALVLGAAR
jgi:hypothetical protein